MERTAATPFCPAPPTARAEQPRAQQARPTSGPRRGARVSADDFAEESPYYMVITR